MANTIMSKDEFYRLQYESRNPGSNIPADEFPPVPVPGENKIAETEEEWLTALTYEMDVDDYVRVSPVACEIAGVDYVHPHEYTRTQSYPAHNEQLDSIYKALKSIKDGDNGIELGDEADGYLDNITAIKEGAPKN
jgi:hypothetical protein